MDAHLSRRIRVLPPLLANQIAAGEVVERPAAVAKELIENSLDAGAGRIEVEVERGGVGLVRVRDDGAGIHPDDLPLALDRHATSKVLSEADLAAITSLGFRGEALASIASVSRLTLTSCTAGEAHGWQLAPEEAQPQPAPHPVGTTVEVRDLFHNTPARRKFLRSERTELMHLEEVVRRIALSRPELALTLRHNGRQVLRLGAAEPQQRVAEVCGRRFAAEAVAVEQAVSGLRLHGWVGRPEVGRSQGDLQYFFVNGRVVRDRLIAHAVRQAHQVLLAAGRHPAYVLFLELDPALVDVNVHPTKHEVRFREARRVHDFLYSVLSRALEGESMVSAAVEPEPLPTAQAPRGAPPAAGAAPRRRPPAAAVAETAARWYAAARPEPASGATALLRLHDRYLLLPDPQRPRLVDLERAFGCLFARAMAEADAGVAVASRPLLIPATVALVEAPARLERAGGALALLGFELEALGPEQAVVRQVPELLGGADTAAVVPPLVETLAAREPVAFGGAEDPLWRELGRWAAGADHSPERLAALVEQLTEEGCGGALRDLDAAALERLFGGDGGA